MILYRLRCSNGHEFDSWFKDSKTYERQEKGGKAAATEEAAAPPAPVPTPTPEQQQMAALARHMPKELREALVKVREQVEKNCEHVGDKFAEEARKIHYGESNRRGIYGETTDQEAEALAEEGIEFGRLPWIPRGN